MVVLAQSMVLSAYHQCNSSSKHHLLADRSIGGAPIVFIGDSFYVICGRVDESRSKTIGRFDAARKVWSKSGELISGRTSHNAIYDGSSLIVIGGKGTQKTERCVCTGNLCNSASNQGVNFIMALSCFLIAYFTVFV